jgi:hypothetical protein
MLLTATSPLVMAATLIPGHRQARFASLRLTAPADDLGCRHLCRCSRQGSRSLAGR